MKKQWKIKELPSQDLALSEYPELIKKLLLLRGFETQEAIEQFLNPDYSKLHDPFKFLDMQRAAERILKAIREQQQIVIYADYDADAITACSVMYKALKKLNAKVSTYIPDRFSEGYGVNSQAIEKIKEQKADLIITVDCGTNSIDETKLANSLGMDVIITDHHEITGELPSVYALINPKNPSDNYPFPYLTGVGVAFKLVQALFSVAPTQRSEHPSTIVEGWEKWLLDLVAVGTVADCQDLTGENRILVSFGLKVLKKTRWLGLQQMLLKAKVNPTNLDTYTLGFILGPRINAAGRIKHADLAFRLLTSESLEEVEELSNELEDLNSHRQVLTEQILSEAKAQIEVSLDKTILIAYGANWPKGVVGLVAGRLTEEFARPVFVLDKGELIATGSGRSVEGFDLVAALKYSAQVLEKYGGHTLAAGLSLKSENINLFYQKVLEYAETSKFELSDPSLNLDLEATIKDLTWEVYELLELFAPFGQGNPKPKFMIRNCKVLDIKSVGAVNQHLKLRLAVGDKIFNAIGFKQGFRVEHIKLNNVINIVFELTANEWNGSKNLELRIIDLKPSDINIF